MLRYIGRTSETRSSGKVRRSDRFSRLAMAFVFASFGSSIASATTISLSAHAESKLDWPFVVSGSAQAQWSPDQSYSSAAAYNILGQEDAHRDPFFPLIPYTDTSVSAQVAGGSSSARTSASELSATADSFRGGPDPWESRAFSNGQRDISLTALSTGVLRLGFHYSSSISASTEGRAKQQAYATTYFQLALQIKGTDLWFIYDLKDLQTNKTTGLTKIVYDYDAPYSNSISGIGYFDIPVAAETEYLMWITSNASTSVESVTVPEPCTVSLAITSIAILGLAGRHRRRNGLRILQSS